MNIFSQCEAFIYQIKAFHLL